MTTFGYVLSSEEWNPHDLMWQSALAQDAGFDSLAISDHFHPWNDQQGASPFVWTVIGAVAARVELPIATHVTCPLIRMHPAIVAHAAATAALLCDGRFVLGVGSGEALNEQVLGSPWPVTATRLEMLAEAVEVMRALWTGAVVTHHGRHYTVEHARLYSRPEHPVPVYVSGFGPKSTELAGRIADGFVSTKPSADALATFDSAGGAGKPKQGAVKVCYGPDREEAVKTAHRLWVNAGLPGELAQELRTPEHLMQASQLVTPDQIGSAISCGPDLDDHLRAIQPYLDAGYDEVLISQVGPRQEEFFRFAADELLPALRGQ